MIATRAGMFHNEFYTRYYIRWVKSNKMTIFEFFFNKNLFRKRLRETNNSHLLAKSVYRFHKIAPIKYTN